MYLHRWRLFRRPIIAQPDRVVIYTQDGEGNIIEGGWRSDEERNTGLEPVSRTSSNRY